MESTMTDQTGTDQTMTDQNRAEPDQTGFVIEQHKLNDNTRLSSWKGCKRRFFYRHVLGLTSGYVSPKLVFGGAWHAAMDTAWLWMARHRTGDKRADLDALPTVVELCMNKFIEHWVSEGLPHPDSMGEDEVKRLDPRLPATAEAMLYHYIERRLDIIGDYDLIEIEKPFIVPLEEGGFYYAGRIDKLLRHKRTGKYVIIEHKTSSWYAREGGFHKNYLMSFSPNSQVDGYLFGASMLYGEENIKEALVDAALVHKQHHDIFTFIPISRQFNNLSLWHFETTRYAKEIAQEIEHYQAYQDQLEKQDIFTLFPRDTGACFDWMEPCPYLDICSVHANPLHILDRLVEETFVVDHWRPYDELDLQQLGVKIK